MVKVFISYSSENKKHLEDIVSALTPLQDSGIITVWYDRDKIHGGDDFHSKIIDNMYDSDIILILMSRDFFYSNYCKNTELPLSKKLMKDGKSKIVPILLSSCSWEKYIKDSTHVLPSKDTPILKETGNKREILLSKVAEEIEVIANTIIEQKKERLEQENYTNNTDGFIPNSIHAFVNDNKKELTIGLGVFILTLFTYFMYLNSTIQSLKHGISSLMTEYNILREQKRKPPEHELRIVSMPNFDLERCSNTAKRASGHVDYIDANHTTREFTNEKSYKSTNYWIDGDTYKVHILCDEKTKSVTFLTIENSSYEATTAADSIERYFELSMFQ